MSWQWQAAAAPSGGAAPAAGDYAAIAAATEAAFTPLQAHVGQYIRVCVTFMDQHSTPNSEGPLCSAGAIITNVDDAPTGMVTLAYAGELTAATEGSPITASHNIMDGDGLAADPTWQWRMAATADGQYSDIAAATAAEFTPLQAHVGMFLQACLSFQDDSGVMGMECASTAMAVANVNDDAAVAEGESLLSYASPITAATEDSPITAITTHISDEDGTANAAYTYAWQQAASADGDFAAIMDGETAVTTAAFTPGDDQVGQVLRVCISFTDGQNGEEMLCEATVPPLCQHQRCADN